MIQGEYETLTRYKCKWCKKIFATTRHNCKFSPSKGNCMSCKHCIGFERARGGEEIEEPACFICEVNDYKDVDDLYLNNWQADCDDYELMDDYEGSISYAKKIADYEEKEALTIESYIKF